MSDAAPIRFRGHFCREYELTIAGRPIRVIGPHEPYALLDRPETMRRFAEDEYLPYWAQPWPAAAMLAEHLLEALPPDRGPILELGSGLGIVAIALTLAGRRVIATDYDDESLEFIRENATRCGVALLDVRRLDWRAPPAERFDVIIAADVTYERRNLEPIAALLATSLAPAGLAFVADANRSAAGGFPAALHAAGLRFHVAPARGPAIGGLDSPETGHRDGRIFCIER